MTYTCCYGERFFLEGHLASSVAPCPTAEVDYLKRLTDCRGEERHI